MPPHPNSWKSILILSPFISRSFNFTNSLFLNFRQQFLLLFRLSHFESTWLTKTNIYLFIY
jgi:hypothetical protein